MAGRGKLGAHGIAKVLAGKHCLQRIAMLAQRRLPAPQSFDRVRREESEIHRQRTTGNLTDQLVAARVSHRDRLELVEYDLRIGTVVKQRCDHHGPARVRGK